LAQRRHVQAPLANPEQLQFLRLLMYEYGWDYTNFLQEAGTLPRQLSRKKASEWINWFTEALK
jgi:hypothetical protein